MPTYSRGRHEHGQNFLVDPRVVDDILSLVATTDEPILEIGPGGGALTVPLSHLGRPLTAVEIDGPAVRRLESVLPAGAELIHGDFLHHRLPDSPHVIVGNLPFHLTTAILRKLLHSRGWTAAFVMCQWEVARRRAGVGGSTMMTAQWSPWFEFALHGRVPASAFRPSPGVDGGLLAIHRRPEPLLASSDRKRFQSMVHQVFTGRGRGVGEIVRRTGILPERRGIGEWLDDSGLRTGMLPRELPTRAWVKLFWRATGRSREASRPDVYQRSDF